MADECGCPECVRSRRASRVALDKRRRAVMDRLTATAERLGDGGRLLCFGECGTPGDRDSYLHDPANIEIVETWRVATYGVTVRGTKTDPGLTVLCRACIEHIRWLGVSLVD